MNKRPKLHPWGGIMVRQMSLTGFTPLEKNTKQKTRTSSLTGFTLLELMVVVVIIAILASLAVPQYMVAVERARSAEGVLILAELRKSQLRYYQEWGGYATTMNTLDFQIENPKFFQSVTVDLTYLGWLGYVRRNAATSSTFPGQYLLWIHVNGEIACGTGSDPFNVCPKMGYKVY